MGPSVRDGRAERTERWLIAAGPATLYICSYREPSPPPVAGFRRYLGGPDKNIWGHGGGGFARLRWHAGQVWAVGGRREAPKSVVCAASAAESVVLTTISP